MAAGVLDADLTNQQIADRLLSFSALLDLAEASPYAARAYRRAADLVRAIPTPVAELVRTGRVRELRGIGPGIEGKLRELVETGDIAELRELEKELRPELVGLGRLLGLSSRRVLEIARSLEIDSAEAFRDAVASGRLQSVPGVGPTTEAKIRAALEAAPRPRRGLTLNRSRALAQSIADALGGHPAGDPRRSCELSFDLAVVCAAETANPVLDAFEQLPSIVAIAERTDRRAVGVTVEGVPVTLVVSEPQRFGTELLRATGSPSYVESLGALPDAATEEEVYTALALPWRPPELREHPASAVPDSLVELTDLQGDLHCHTVWSDGRATVEEMGRAARDRGYAYLAICDHTANVRVVPGLDADQLRRQGEEIAQATERLAPLRLLRGSECDILPDGSLDLDDAILAELDWVQISLHAGQRRERRELTRIVCEAMRNPHASALSHPKGRILNHRPENALDLDEVFQVALETGTALEINGLPDRLDLSSAHAADALDAGVKLVLSSDAHSVQGLSNVELAVATARRAGATRESIVNAGPFPRPRR
ncbi:MAG: PHP domain-containing protein [Actinomycetota bacterium]|nr:PHP domain-containing protein [Actinomycetota bacterium]